MVYIYSEQNETKQNNDEEIKQFTSRLCTRRHLHFDYARKENLCFVFNLHSHYV